MSSSRAQLLALAAVALLACATAQTAFTEIEEVPNAADDHLKVAADGKTCAKWTRTRVCRQKVEQNVTKCPENPGYEFKLQPPCIAEQPCLKHSVSCGSTKIGSTKTCLKYKKIRTCPLQCENGQLCDVAKVCQTLGGVTACEWTRSCKSTPCQKTACSFTRECVRYTEKDAFVHRCNEGECEQLGDRTRTCKSVPVCKVPEVTETVQTCARWGRWKKQCVAWFPPRITVLRKQYNDAQETATAAFNALKATNAYQNREELRAEVLRANEEVKTLPEYASYKEKQDRLSCVYSELSCRYFGGWKARRQHCRAWLACSPCEYAAFACRTATQGAWKTAQCEKKRSCRNDAKFNPSLHVVMTQDK